MSSRLILFYKQYAPVLESAVEAYFKSVSIVDANKALLGLSEKLMIQG